MNCDIVEEHLSAYIDQELDAVACLQLEDHVDAMRCMPWADV